MGVIDPKMFDACVQVTNRVLAFKRGSSESGVNCGFDDVGVRGVHHFNVSPRSAARVTQEAMFAS